MSSKSAGSEERSELGSRSSAIDAVLLLSGGLDSAANLALWRAQGRSCLALSVDYGQQAWESELRAARALAAHFGSEHGTLELSWLGSLGGSALTDQGVSLPQLERAVLDDEAVTRASAKQVWVPNRNGVLIHAAAALAERRGADVVLVGFNREEGATFPDNTQAYLDAVTGALAFSTANHVRVQSLTTAMDKREIVAELRRRVPGFPFDRVWSCYRAGDRICGACESCQRFLRATG